VVRAIFDQVDQRFYGFRVADLTERLRRFLPSQVRLINERRHQRGQRPWVS
jgi:hypothetical protein